MLHRNSPKFQSHVNCDRHCERSEAIHRGSKESVDCFVAALLAMTGLKRQ
jgi:hypothetical protein